MSIAGGVHKALQRGLSISCQSVQIFTKNQLRWAAPALRDEEIEAFHSLRGAFHRVLAHASYLINLASPEEEVFSKSITAFTEELQRCRALGIPDLILHPGSHRDRGFAWGSRRLVQGVRSVYREEEDDQVRLVLETTAGAGSTLGGSFEQLRDLLGALETAGIPVGICFDTCHAFAGGYELRDRSGYRRTWDRFEEVIGLDYLRAIHLNDSKTDLGSGRDRHEHIGKGKIGLPGFKLLIQDQRFKDIPGILETPKGADMMEDVENLSLLRSLSGRGA